MNKHVLTTVALFVLCASTIADAQWRSKTHDVYNALIGVEVKLDGELDEWDGVLDTVTGTDGKPFCGVEYSGNVFQEHNGCKWIRAYGSGRPYQ